MTDQKNPRRPITEGARPQNKAVGPTETHGARPATSTPKPPTPPSGGSGITPSPDGRK